MRTYAQKPKAPSQTTTARSTIPNWAHFGERREANAMPHSLRATGHQTGAEEPDAAPSPRLGHDFIRISVLRPAAAAIQTKLAISEPGDEYEREADQVSERVLRMPEPQRERDCSCGGGCPRCQTERRDRGEEHLQTKRVETSDTGEIAASQGVHEVLRSSGQPLDCATRAFMEPRFGHDFSRVRVHTHAEAAKSASGMHARAFTSGQDIFFGRGEYNPSSRVGQVLLAHELTHVVQQGNVIRSKRIQRAPDDGPKDPSIAGTSGDAIEMWKDVIAQRHFQKKAGNVTFARMKIVDSKGNTVVNILTESDESLHAEEKAIGDARKLIPKGQTVVGGKMIFVTDQTVCDKPGRCRAQISKFAQELGMEEATATIIRRAALPEEPGPLAGPKPTAKKIQKTVVAGLELTTSTETIYKRAGNVPGGTLSPVKPPAQTASGDLTTGKPTGKTASGGGGGTLAPVKPPARTASGDVTRGDDVPVKPNIRPVGPGRGGPNLAADAEEAEEIEAGGGGGLGGLAAVAVEVIGPMLHALAWALIPALTNQLWERDKKTLEAEILQRLNQPNSLRRIADHQIDELGVPLYGNVTVEIVTEDAIQTLGTTDSGFPIMNAVSYYASSRLIDVNTSNRDLKNSTEKTGSRNLPGQSTTVHTVTQTYSFALPQLENKVLRARLKERIAELDREMARLSLGASNSSLQLLRDELNLRLQLYRSD
jgi:Domain of unknown function (DUF4157)